MHNSGHYNFPIIRYGNICALSENIDLDLDVAEQIGTQIKQRCEEIPFEEEFKKFIEEKNKYSIISPQVTRPPRVELWEGWVALTPRLQFKVKDDQLSNRVSIVVCIRPNHNKIWVNLLFKGNSSQAVGLTRDKVDSFFSNYKDLATLTVEFAREKIYKEALSALSKEWREGEVEIECEKEIIIKAVGSSHPHFIELTSKICLGNVVNFLDEFRSEKYKEVLKDFLFFAFNREIDVDEYQSLIEQRKKEWADRKDQIKERYPHHLIEQGGLQWFGLKRGEIEGFFLRVESLDEKIISFFGKGTETDKLLNKALKKAKNYDLPDVVSRRISRFLVENISPFI